MTALAPASTEDVLIHVRFRADGTVFTIDGCPSSMSGQDWFVRLYEAASPFYAALAGGRGFFRIPRDRFMAALPN